MIKVYKTEYKEPTRTGLYIDGQEIVQGTELTSRAIFFDYDSDITAKSGNYLLVSYKRELAAWVLIKYGNKGAEGQKLFSEFLDGWQPSIFQIRERIA